jgi:hypothetical protein
MEDIAYVWDLVEGKPFLGYNLVALIYADPEKEYPLNFAYKTKENDRISLAIELTEELVDLGLEVRLMRMHALLKKS